MIFQRKNAVGDLNYFDVLSYDIDLYRDPQKPHTCKLKVAKDTPFQPFDVVTVDDRGHIPFRGYVSNMSVPTSRVGEKTIECESIETVLNHRYLPVWTWGKRCTLGRIFSSDTPDVAVGVLTWYMPLIWWAQSYIPCASPHYRYKATGTGYPYGTPNITVIDGAGTSSRIGSRDIYVWGYPATEYDSWADVPELLPGPVIIRDDTDLQIGLTSNFRGCGSQNYGLAADMAFDCGLRVRNLDNPGTELGFHLRTDYDPAWDLIVNLATKVGLHVHVWYDQDGLTYLDFIASAGRGETDGQFTFYETDIFVESLVPSLKKVSALIGRGLGDGPSRQITSQFDLSYRGIWVEDILDVPNGLAEGSPLGSEVEGNMQDIIDAQYAARNTDLGYRIKLHPNDLIPRISDHVGLIDQYGEKHVFEVKKIKYSSSNPYVLVDIGTTPDDLYDAFQAAAELSTVGGEMPYISQNPYTDSKDMTFGDADTACVPATFSVTFATGSGYYDHCRILASFSYSLPSCMGYPIGSNPLLSAHAFCYAEINGKTQNMYIGGGGYLLGDAVSYADVTDFLKLDGTAESIKFYVKSYGLFTTPQTVSVSMTLTPVWLD